MAAKLARTIYVKRAVLAMATKTTFIPLESKAAGSHYTLFYGFRSKTVLLSEQNIEF